MTEKCYQTEHNSYSGKYRDDLYLRPTAFFKMVVDGTHFEHTLARELKGDDLNHNRKTFKYPYTAYGNKKNFHL